MKYINDGKDKWLVRVGDLKRELHKKHAEADSWTTLSAKVAREQEILSNWKPGREISPKDVNLVDAMRAGLQLAMMDFEKNELLKNRRESIHIKLGELRDALKGALPKQQPYASPVKRVFVRIWGWLMSPFRPALITFKHERDEICKIASDIIASNIAQEISLAKAAIDSGNKKWIAEKSAHHDRQVWPLSKEDRFICTANASDEKSIKKAKALEGELNQAWKAMFPS
ncbi:hypothetical protein FNU76_12970 [Chitinimonas arctica]|uniref:Uncharacterized protein n=1 Tax=Chitinimonas arctica TaxID=2594795 RepID=A0A516SGA7_9NEIS|nr:hypothetical protein [Chitinimonas arctica]QDQ27199.1 hypothetical protein FNU76_12970 [Chitinimonas arctica]